MVQGTSGCALIVRGQRNGVPVRVASTGASNARDSESICKPNKKTAHPTSAIKRDNAAKTWIVQWQFRGANVPPADRRSEPRVIALTSPLFPLLVRV